jgi:hypothetical protein
VFSVVLGGILVLCSLILDVPKNVADIGNMSLRTAVFEPLALGSVAWLLPDPDSIPGWAYRRLPLAARPDSPGLWSGPFPRAGTDRDANPEWIPWHVFWVAFFGAGFVAASFGIGLNLLRA